MKGNHDILTNSRKGHGDLAAMPLFIGQLKVFSIVSETYYMSWAIILRIVFQGSFL
jgi:hypothetical protein